MTTSKNPLKGYSKVTFHIEKQYENLLKTGEERAKSLTETCKAYQLVREAADLGNWIKQKEQHATSINK